MSMLESNNKMNKKKNIQCKILIRFESELWMFLQLN